jgi:hypothetical protein
MLQHNEAVCSNSPRLHRFAAATSCSAGSTTAALPCKKAKTATAQDLLNVQVAHLAGALSGECWCC